MGAQGGAHLGAVIPIIFLTPLTKLRGPGWLLTEALAKTRNAALDQLSFPSGEEEAMCHTHIAKLHHCGRPLPFSVTRTTVATLGS